MELVIGKPYVVYGEKSRLIFDINNFSGGGTSSILKSTRRIKII